jgi:hypothetical protein
LATLGAELQAQLASCEDAPTLLLLAVLLALHRWHGLAVHASGNYNYLNSILLLSGNYY